MGERVWCLAAADAASLGLASEPRTPATFEADGPYSTRLPAECLAKVDGLTLQIWPSKEEHLALDVATGHGAGVRVTASKHCYFMPECLRCSQSLRLYACRHKHACYCPRLLNVLHHCLALYGWSGTIGTDSLAAYYTTMPA